MARHTKAQYKPKAEHKGLPTTAVIPSLYNQHPEFRERIHAFELRHGYKPIFGIMKFLKGDYYTATTNDPVYVYAGGFDFHEMMDTFERKIREKGG